MFIAMEMTEDHRTLNTYYDNFGGGWGWRRWGGGFGDGFGTSTTTEETYKVARWSSTCSIPTLRN
jgi:hypothetical protein